MYNLIHGANPENLYHTFNIPMPEKIIDFSTNTNITAWPEFNIDIKALASSYPDPECRKLVKLISEHEGISPTRILFTNGINQAIFLLARLFENNTAIIQPTYSEYKRAFTSSHDIFTLEVSGQFSQVIITNPNNPTGFYMRNLSEIIKRFHNTIFIIDEAYIDFVLDYKPERLCDFGNVIILRSLTKIFHLSGARIGYVIADDKIISALKNFLPTWSVNSIAQELTLQFLNDETFCSRTRDFYRDHTPKFMNDLRDVGFEVADSDVHYFLVRVEDDVEAVKFLLRNGLVVRHTRNFTGLSRSTLITKGDRRLPPTHPADGRLMHYVRVATRLPEENRILVEAMKELAR